MNAGYSSNRSLTHMNSRTNSRRPSKVEANLDERWRISEDHYQQEFGITNVVYQPDQSLEVPRRCSQQELKQEGYSIKKKGSNLQITMPVAHDVYMSHQVQNKVRTAHNMYQDDSNESSV